MTTATLLLTSWLATAAPPPEPGSEHPSRTACRAITHADLRLSGLPADATIEWEGASIRRVGVGPASPGCDVTDAAGAPVTPGFIDPFSQLGLVGVDAEPTTVSSNPLLPVEAGAPAGSGPLQATFRVAQSYDPRSPVIAVTRIAGVTGAVLVPEGALVSGVAAFVELDGEPIPTDPAQSAAVGMLADLRAGNGPRPGTLETLREVLEEARWFDAHAAEWEKGDGRDPLFPPHQLRAFGPVVRGSVPLLVLVDRAVDLSALLRMTAGSAVRLVIVGGAEAWLVADALAARRVPVIVDALLNGPTTFDTLAAREDNAALLDKAGVPLMLSSFSTHNARTLPQMCGNAVRSGLSATAALRAVTATPANIFGQTALGRIEVGARASLVVWSGDPFEVTSAPTSVFIGGDRIPLVSRQSRLRERYRSPSPRVVP